MTDRDSEWLEAKFEECENDFLEFDRVENKLSSRPDLHAFILLNELVPSDRDMIASAEHDQIWLDVDADQLAKVITEEQIITLRRCGVFYADWGLSMFV